MWKMSKMHTSNILPFIRRFKLKKETIRFVSASSDVNDRSNLKPWTQIPGPKSYPIVGPLFSLLPGGELYNIEWSNMFQMLYAKYGPIVKFGFTLNKPTVFLYDAEGTAQILRGENQMPVRQAIDSLTYYRKVIRNPTPNSPSGLITDNGFMILDADLPGLRKTKIADPDYPSKDNVKQGELWQQLRSLVNPVLMQPKIMSHYIPVIDEVALEMVERLKSLRDDQNMIINLERELTLWTLESLGVVALGCRIKCFNDNLDKDSPVQQLIKLVPDMMTSFRALDFSPSIWKYYPTKAYRKAMECYKKHDEITRNFIERAIKDLETNPSPDDRKGVMEKLLEINKEAAFLVVSDMLIGGIETIIHTVLGVLYLLASYPDKQSKLRAELRNNDEDRIYLKACIKEAIRLMPIGFGNIRETTKEHSILGYKIPKGVNVIIVHQEMSRMDNYFVKPHEYIPERWIVDKDDPLSYKNGHPFAYRPFGFGARACIGRRVAETEIETFVARVIESFEMEWRGPPPKIEQDLVNYVRGPYYFVFKNANN